MPALLADITNVLRNGDIVICVDENAPQIVECKLAAAKELRFERQGRRGRQRARIESISRFLRSGKGRFSGDDREHHTLELSRRPVYGFEVVDKIVSAALQHCPSTCVISEFELYSAALLGEHVQAADAIRDWKVRPGESVAIGSASDPLRGGWPDIRPPILWDLSEPARWALMEGDVELSHAVRVEAFVGLQRGDVFVRRAIETPGPFSWSYELMVLGDPFVVTPNLMFEVVYAHETIESAGQRLLDLAEAATRAMLGDAV